jgi:hypothetical protein
VTNIPVYEQQEIIHMASDESPSMVDPDRIPSTVHIASSLLPFFETVDARRSALGGLSADEQACRNGAAACLARWFMLATPCLQYSTSEMEDEEEEL